MAKQTKRSIEEEFEILEQIITKLSDDNTTLEEAMQIYQQGVVALQSCKGILDKAEKEIKVLQNDETDN